MEEEIIAKLRNKSNDAYSLLYSSYKKPLINSLRGIIKDTNFEWDDLIQEIFIAVYTNINKYDSSKGRMFTWIKTISINICIDHVRKHATEKRREKKIWEALYYNYKGESTTRVDRLDIKELAEKVCRNPTIVIMHHVNDLSHTQISQALNMKFGTVKTLLRADHKRLREAYPYLLTDLKD